MPYAIITSQHVASLFRDLGLPHGKIRQIPGGWSSWTFEVDNVDPGEPTESPHAGWIFRFPRNSVVAENQKKETAILPVIASRVNFAVPRFEYVGSWCGNPYVGYRRIPGRPLSARTFTRRNLAQESVESIAEVLTLLHDIPTSLVAEACAVEPTVDHWWRRYYVLREEVRTKVIPLLVSTEGDAVVSTLDAVERGFDRFLDEELATLEDVALVHCDLGCEHILMDEDEVTVAGLIDFEDATIGDPTIDFVGIYVTYGMEAVRRVRDGYRRALDINFEKRLKFYTWMASCHEIIYGLEEGRSDLVERGIAGLRARLECAGFL